MSFLEVLFILSCLCAMPMCIKLYFLENILYKNETIITCVTQTIIGMMSDTYNLYYNNRFSKVMLYIDRFHVSCISFPVIFVVSYSNNAVIQISPLIIAILFWINQHILFRININVKNLSIKKLQMWNHILWHTFMSIGCYQTACTLNH
jgi:hypothetical protein